MSTFTQSLRQLRCQGKAFRAPWPQPAWQRASFPLAIRTIATETSTSIVEPKPDALALSTDANSKFAMPFQGVDHARAVPLSASYFSREPQFNEMYLRIARLLTKYHALPIVPSSNAPPTAWVKLQEMRSKLGEPIKASHYAKVIRVAKRLNQIEPSLFPEEVRAALEEFKRDINPFMNVPHEVIIDKYGRAVGVGKRKESTARAWVVEGTGEVLINGKTLSQAFGRVHDRESAVWALQATERLDKYNIWALVEGGGTTGQAEALTLAVAKALIVHEPALKTALRKGMCLIISIVTNYFAVTNHMFAAGCITRDPRTVERKKHGHVKARKMPAWVKR
ncbi:hypothetical protein HYE67_006873 [Fusarium culmorum]|uniref:37S ribosomal protein S9, mitochondrial n=1 Tax=Fusarium culmorum TaxID=5516 RepID=A0A7S8D9U8_FUSCU|nr:hypothetical protein HYE67_006873 [Fusarium culmorum]